MESRRLLIIIASLALVATVCVCTSSIVFLGYNVLGDQISSIFNEAGEIFDSQVESPPIAVETDTPLGAEIDLFRLFSPFWESRELLHEIFVEQPIDDEALAAGALTGLLGELEIYGVDLDDVDLPTAAPSPANLSEEANTPDEVIDYFGEFWAAWGEAEYAQLDGQVSYEDLMHASLRGMVDALGDEHTWFLDPDDLLQSDNSLEGEYEGIGAWVDPTTDYLTIIAPMQGSPAEAAGLQPGDRVIAIDGDDMTGIEGNAVISRILGPAGSLVVLTIDRDDVELPFEVEIERAAIFVASVESEMLEGEIGYIRLLTFGASSSSEFRNALEELLAQNPKGLVFDLRNNGGGFVQTAVEVTSEFISEGVVLYEAYGDGSRDTHRALSNGVAIDIPLVVLINQGSASSAEIVAGALQDFDRAILVGETSFGKGSVQTSPLLSDGQGAMRITIAYWLTPEERQIHGVGLVPDVVVEFTQEDFDAELDPQLDAAIELLSE
jgi:carboxyl-terminal processing protease